jgi:hypothetical protein
MRLLIAGLIFAASMGAASRASQAPDRARRTFTGIITDGMCAAGNHSDMKMGPTDAACATACVSSHGALFVLFDGTNAFTLSDQKAPEKLAGQKVTVTGTLNPSTRTIQVESIAITK